MEKDIRKEKPEVIFLLGAGISVPFGIPAMRGIFNEFMNKKKSRITDQQKRICKMLIDDFHVEKDLEEFLLATNSILNSKNSHLIHFVKKTISRQKASNKIKEFENKYFSTLKDIEDVQNSILDFMSTKCFTFERDKAVNILSNFVTAVSLEGYPIYTTNYDYALEHTAMSNDIKLFDNFTLNGLRNIWNNDIQFPIGGGLTIVKLHGSVTWYRDDEGVIEKINSKTDFNTYGKPSKNLLVFPTRFKDIYEQHFFSLYSHFLFALSDAKCLVVAGHSLRDEYLRAGIIERMRQSDFRIVVIDPIYPQSIENALKPAPIGRSGKIIHIPEKFEDFTDELAHIIQNQTVSDIIDKCTNVVKYGRYKKNKVKIKGRIQKLVPKLEKTCTVSLDCYIPRAKKPAYLRVWVEADYSLPTGENKNRLSGKFIENKLIPLANGNTGLVQGEYNISFTVPKYDEWLAYAKKIFLCVGIITRQSSKPANSKKSFLIASDQRELPYTKV